MQGLRNFGIAAVLAATLAPAALADGRNPGSVLVYPVQRSGPQFFTVVSVTNTNLMPATPMTFGGSTLVHFEYANTVANPADPCVPLNCVIFDRVEFLTPADTLSVLTSCHNAVSPNGQAGYLVVSAQDPTMFDVAWSFDFLIGSELVVNASGGMYSLNAIPFTAVPAALAATDVDLEGDLDFDGVEYEGIADQLYIDSFLAIDGSQLSLINLTGGPRDLNTLQFDIWNDNEFPLSTTKTFACWFDLPLTQVSPLFAAAFLAGVPNDPGELDLTCNGLGNIETGWARIESVDVSTQGGNFIAADGAILGAITAGPMMQMIDGGHLLWESPDVAPTAKQTNGAFVDIQVDP